MILFIFCFLAAALAPAALGETWIVLLLLLLVSSFWKFSPTSNLAILCTYCNLQWDYIVSPWISFSMQSLLCSHYHISHTMFKTRRSSLNIVCSCFFTHINPPWFEGPRTTLGRLVPPILVFCRLVSVPSFMRSSFVLIFAFIFCFLLDIDILTPLVSYLPGFVCKNGKTNGLV